MITTRSVSMMPSDRRLLYVNSLAVAPMTPLAERILQLGGRMEEGLCAGCDTQVLFVEEWR